MGGDQGTLRNNMAKTPEVVMLGNTAVYREYWTTQVVVCGYGVIGSITAFQAVGAGSNPVTRSMDSWCNGNTLVSRTKDQGSIPWVSA